MYSLERVKKDSPMQNVCIFITSKWTIHFKWLILLECNLCLLLTNEINYFQLQFISLPFSHLLSLAVSGMLFFNSFSAMPAALLMDCSYWSLRRWLKYAEYSGSPLPRWAFNFKAEKKHSQDVHSFPSIY